MSKESEKKEDPTVETKRISLHIDGAEFAYKDIRKGQILRIEVKLEDDGDVTLGAETIYD